MTATQSLSPTPKPLASPLLRSIRLNLWENRKLLLAQSILHLLGLPLMTLTLVMTYIEESKYTPDDHVYIKDYFWLQNGGGFIAIGMLAFLFALLLGILVAFNLFNHCHKRSRVDMILALPMSTKQRFWSNFLSGLLFYTVPLLLSGLLSGLILTIGSAICNPLMHDLKEATVSTYLLLIACGLAILFMLYATAIFATVCCGTSFETGLCFVGMNALLPTACITTFSTFVSSLYGLDTSGIMERLIQYAGPFGGVFFVVSQLENEVFLNNQSKVILWIAAFVLITLALVALTRFLYGKRKAEDTGKPYVFKLLYYVAITIALYCFYALFAADNSFPDEISVPMLLFSAILYLTTEVITNRGFKKIGWSILRYAVSTVAIIGLIAFVINTDGFGRVYYVPTQSSVQEVTFSVPMQYLDCVNPDKVSRSQQVTLTTSDEDMIEDVLEVHQFLLDEHKSSNASRFSHADGYISARDRLDVTYQKSFGRTITRAYALDESAYVNSLTRSTAVRYACLDELLPPLDNRETNKRIYLFFYSSVKTEFQDLDCVYSLTADNYEAFREEIREAYFQDLEENPDLDTATPFCSISGLKVPINFSKTITILTQYCNSSNCVQGENPLS